MSRTDPTWQNHLVTINACSGARDWCADYPTTREGFALAWEECPNSAWMLWLAMRVLPRRRAVGVLIEVVRATCAHLTVDEVTTDVLNPLAAWAQGADVDVAAVRERAWEIRRRLWTAADAAAAAATATARAAARAAAYTADAAADAAAVRYAQTDIVRAHLGAGEVYDALMGGG